MIEDGRDLDEALRLIEGIERWNATHRLETRYAAPYPHVGGPYPWQVAFHEAGAKYIERASICANQVGKCLIYSHNILTPHGEVEAWRLRPGDRVMSWDGSRMVEGHVRQVLHMPAERALRVWLRSPDGRVRTLTGSPRHRVLTPLGWRFLGDLCCTRGHGSDSRPVRDGGGVRCSGTGTGSRCGCPCGRGSGDAPPRPAGDAGRCASPSPADARGRTRTSWRTGAPGSAGTDTPSARRILPSSRDAVLRIAVPALASALRECGTASSRSRRWLRSSLRLPPGSSLRPRRGDAAATHEPRSASACCPFVVGGVVDIVAHEWLDERELIDFEIGPHHNYIAGGIVNHNSFAASAEVAIHSTGLYPSWWKGRRIAEPNDWWVCEPTNLFCRDIAQTLLLGSVGGGEGEDRAPDGTGWVPLDRIGEFGFRQCGIPNVIDRVKIRHQSGGWSTIQFKSYEQSPTMFEGATLNGGVWLDEEPEGETAMTIFSSCRTRVVVKGGMVLFTRTPLFGHSGIVRHFMGGKEGIWYQNVTWDDAPHMTAEMKRAAEMSYPEHERDARTKGVPMLGSGAVYAVAQSLYTCEAFPIPPHWRRICGIDFGIDHPAAGAWIAHDPDTDTIYVYDAYRMSGKVAAYHAQAIRSRGDWIPVAWPHDGAIRDKGGGVALAEQYRECGANMMPFSARLDDEKGGGQPREPTTQAILQRMHTGQFKVFSHLSELLEEMRMLHRKDGVIVPVNDDTEAAVRYATMMLRHACTKSEAVSPRPAFSEDYDPLESFR